MDASSPEEELKLLEIRLNQLKLDYEKYFLGTRPTEPAMQRAEIQKVVLKVVEYPDHQHGAPLQVQQPERSLPGLQAPMGQYAPPDRGRHLQTPRLQGGPPRSRARNRTRQARGRRWRCECRSRPAWRSLRDLSRRHARDRPERERTHAGEAPTSRGPSRKQRSRRSLAARRSTSRSSYRAARSS